MGLEVRLGVRLRLRGAQAGAAGQTGAGMGSEQRPRLEAPILAAPHEPLGRL